MLHRPSYAQTVMLPEKMDFAVYRANFESSDFLFNHLHEVEYNSIASYMMEGGYGCRSEWGGQ